MNLLKSILTAALLTPCVAFPADVNWDVYLAKLPAAGYATPATYSVKGRQYVVIACGGGKIGTKSGDAYMAFVLPAKE